MAIKQRSPTGQDPQKLQRRSHKAISAAPLLVASSFGQAIPIASSFEEAFQTLLKNPIKFVLATSLTSKDEARMAPVLRPRKRLNESHAQQQNRMSVWNISSRWGAQQDSPRLSKGFRNRTGTNCYKNSVLQALLHAPKFVNWLDIGHSNCAADAGMQRHCLACALRILSERYWALGDNQNAIDEAVMMVENRLRAAGWNHGGQQDAHDLYQHLTTTLQYQLPSDAAVIEALFVSTLSQTLICAVCGDHSTTGSTEYSIGVPFGRPTSLIDLIRSGNVLGPDTVPGSRCSKCNHQADRQRLKRIVTPPEILVVQIRRFTSDQSTHWQPKVRKEDIPFSERLDLSLFIDGQATLKYRLFAVVHHAGTMNNGHYITVARGPGGNWEEINDSRVQTKGVRMGNAMKPGKGWSPYLLFWERVGGEVAEAPMTTHDERFWAAKDEQRDLATIRRTMVHTNLNGFAQEPSYVRRTRKRRR